MKSKTKIFVVLGVAFFLIAAGVLTFVFWPKDNIKEVYTKAVKDSLGLGKSLSKDEEKNIYDGKILKMDFEYNDLSGELPKNNKFEVIVDDTKEDASSYILLDMFTEELGKNEQYEMILEENKVFFTVKEMFDKYYFVESNEEDSAGNDAKDLSDEMISDAFEEAFFGVIDSENINKDDKEISINGKKYDSTKYSYTFTGSDTYSIIDNALKKIKEKDELQYESIVQNISLESLESLKSMGNLFTYTVYLDSDDNVLSSNISINFELQEQKFNVIFAQQSVDGYFKFYVSFAGQRLIDIELNEESDKKIAMSLSMMGKKIITGELVAESESLVSFSFKNTQNLDVDVDIQGTITKENDDVNIIINSVIGENVKNEIKLIIEVLDEMPKYDVSNNAPIEEMTEEELAYIRKRFGFIFDIIQGNSLATNYD